MKATKDDRSRVENPVEDDRIISASDEKFHRLLEYIDLGIAWIDADYRVIFANSAMGRICGKPGANFVGRHCHEIFWDEIDSCVDCPGQEAMETGERVTQELDMILANGTQLQVRVNAFPIFSDEGRISGFAKVVEDLFWWKKLEKTLHENGQQIEEKVDEVLEGRVVERTASLMTANLALKKEISKRKEIEKELHTRQQDHLKKHEELSRLFNMVKLAKREWESTMDCLKEVVVLVDREKRIRRSNKALAELTGIPLPDLIGREIAEVLYGDGVNAEELFKLKGEFCHVLSGRWFLINHYPIDEGAEEGGAVITLYDYTGLKQLNCQLQDSNRMLESKSRELEKAYQDLKAAQVNTLNQEKMATIGQLAAGVAHEINNPIGFVSSNLRSLKKYLDRLTEFLAVQDEALQAGGDSEAMKTVAAARKKLKPDFIVEDLADLIEESLDGTERVRKIVLDLKTFSRVDDAEWKFVDLTECLESTINMAWNEIKYKATLERDFAELPLVRCFPHQINQVFMNLLINAAQAIEKEGRITVRTWQEGPSVFFAFSDTGCGISPENLNQIFEPFFTTKEIGKGTGLGLSLSFEIIQKHQGDIRVESEIGKGTSFTVRIPIDGGENVGEDK